MLLIVKAIMGKILNVQSYRLFFFNNTIGTFTKIIEDVLIDPFEMYFIIVRNVEL